MEKGGAYLWADYLSLDDQATWDNGNFSGKEIKKTIGGALEKPGREKVWREAVLRSGRKKKEPAPCHEKGLFDAGKKKGRTNETRRDGCVKRNVPKGMPRLR